MKTGSSTHTRPKSGDYLLALQELGFTFRMNQCTDRVEVNGAPMTDTLESVIFTKLRDKGFHEVNVARDVIVAHAYHNKYHPIMEYLNSLSYDGNQHIKRLASFFDNPDGTFPIWLTRWLIGAVRRVMVPGAQNRMLVLDGPQNVGKSKFVQWLIPTKLRRNHFISGPINPDQRDQRIALMERWIWEVAELGSTTRRADLEALKFFITLEQVSERVPYGRYTLQKPALSNFIGTVNSVGGLLADPTGNRRYMFSKIKSIDWEGYTQAIDVDQVWAEAVMLYIQGEPADLTDDELKIADQLNKNYEVENPIEGRLMAIFQVDPAQGGWWTSTTEIIKALEDPYLGAFKGPTNITSRELANLMTVMGCEHVRSRQANGSNPIWGYRGVKRIGP